MFNKITYNPIDSLIIVFIIVNFKNIIIFIIIDQH